MTYQDFKCGRKRGISDEMLADIEPYDRLRLEIVLRAIYDYHLLGIGNVRTEYIGNKQEIESFFKSEWCDFLLNGIDGISRDDILREIGAVS